MLSTKTRLPWAWGLVCALAIAPGARAAPSAEGPTCERTLSAHVVTLDQVYSWNRFGAVQPHGMIYALERDVVPTSHREADVCKDGVGALEAGRVRLRASKRPRPLVLRANVGDCLDIHFTNLLASSPRDEEQPATREASVHVVGMQYRQRIEDSGMWVADDPSGLVAPGDSRTYRLYAQEEGTFLLYSGGAMVGGEGDNGSISAGLFGALTVQPRGSRVFRSQVSQEDFARASTEVDGFPRVDYGATYDDASDPDACWRLGSPILEMVERVDGAGEIVHSDLTAIVTGPELDGWPAQDYPYPLADPLYPERNEPYREFTIIFHDEIGAVQAFPHFEDEVFSHTLHSVRDAFAINYGTGGVGAEILANRLGVGPVHDCLDCKYEEFFLASWAVGDPAMVVDKPANSPCSQTPADWQAMKEGRHRVGADGLGCEIAPGPKATKALYPDDPSNVYHSYMNDRVKYSPRSDASSYLDSQSIGQGASFTYEIAHRGSGNINKTVGDSIFHCHFYPHFAQGMWSLWRVHDVLETGTVLGDDGRPEHTVTDGVTTTTTRALPDDEIAVGTPIPAIVPLPGKPLAPPPTPVRLVDGQIDRDHAFAQADAAFEAWRDDPSTAEPWFSPGYPFYIPGRAGHRAPHPPLDFALDEEGKPRDGGLPRHVVVDNAGSAFSSAETRLDFHKEVLAMEALNLDEEGTPLEKLAMATHELPGFDTPSSSGADPSEQFALNGQPPRPGAPFADPCPPYRATSPRRFQAVDVELDVIFNKAGWHFPQQRIITLLEDVPATLDGSRPPEPLFFRAESGDCISYEMTNLVPFEYQVDDFQVRTPTDVLGQHIHLVKFDVTSSDGGGNGFNYEDGTFSPEEVQERIAAIRALNGCAEGDTRTVDPATGRLDCPVPRRDPRFAFLDGGDKNCNGFEDVLGAQTTVQRWWADPLPQGENAEVDRTLRTVFTHDHFGPSTHQQAGLYAGLVVEPEGSRWYHNEVHGLQLGTRADGGPTSWQARIVLDEGDGHPDYREFLLEFADFQLAYEINDLWRSCPDELTGWADPAAAINPAGRRAVGPPDLYLKPDVCPTNDDDPDGTLLASIAPSKDGKPLPPCPEAVSADDPGIFVVNYRNEPLAHRISDTFAPGATPSQVPGREGDLSFAYASLDHRANPEMNKVPDETLAHVPYPALTRGLEAGDPFTPVLRAYEGDPVQMRVLVGAHEEEHNFSIHGRKWRFEPFLLDSGYRNSQMVGLSEWFDFILPPIPSVLGQDQAVDLLYEPNSSAEGQWLGTWGLLRQYQGPVGGLPTLGSNVDGRGMPGGFGATDFNDARRAEMFRSAPRDEMYASPSDDGRDEGTDDPGGSGEEASIGCPKGSERPTTVEVVAVAAREVLPTATLLYNRRADQVRRWDDETKSFDGTEKGPLHDPTAILFVLRDDLVYDEITGRPRLAEDAPVEPLILRAAANDCLRVVLENDLPPGEGERAFDLPGWNGWHMLHERFNANDVRPSQEVGLHPQLLYSDPTRSDGTNTGLNLKHFDKQTVAPGESITYYWYAGDLGLDSGGAGLASPIEFGATGLMSSDPLKHSNKGAVGALVIEPRGSTWTLPGSQSYLSDAETRRTRAVADVRTSDGASFREFVVVYQDDLNLRYADGDPVPSLDINEDPTESGQKAFNYRTEPLWFRLGYSPDTPGSVTRELQSADVLTDGAIGGRSPVTPVFGVDPGEAVRLRVVHPGGHTQNHAFEVQGHLWQELPFNDGSARLGASGESEWQGVRHGIGPGTHFDQLLESAGGLFQVPGAYVYRDYVSWGFHNGLWGLLRVRDDQGSPSSR
jgi:hypothetical protein